MAKPDGKLTPAQHEIMEIVWTAGDFGATVTEIWTEIARRREVARTTVLNLVDRLEKRGWLKRRRRRGAFRYFAAMDRAQTSQVLAEEFVDDFFGGSASELVMSLLGGGRLNQDQVQQLRQLLDKRAREEKRGE